MKKEEFVTFIENARTQSDKGMLVILNGMDGAGKGVQFEQLYALFPEAIRLREPGGTPEAEQIRFVLLDNEATLEERCAILERLLSNQHVTALCKTYIQKALHVLHEEGLTGDAEAQLYAASRAQTNLALVKPHLQEKKFVLGERSVACSMAYQGHARGLGMEKVWTINLPAIAETLPTLEIFIDVDPSIAQERLKGRTEKQDRLDKESFEFHQKTRIGYLDYYQNYCPYPYQIVDGSGTIEETFDQIQEVIVSHLTKNQS